MANIKSQKKRNRQNEKIRGKNASVKSSIRTGSKKIVKKIEAKEAADPTTLKTMLQNFIKTIDSAARKGIVHKKTAARKKSRLSRAVNAHTKQA